MRKVKKAKWLVVLMVVAMLFTLVPATASAGHEGPGAYAFIPNSGEASVSKVFLAPDPADSETVARYWTAPRQEDMVDAFGEESNDPFPFDPYDWRTARLAIDSEGNAWAINTGADAYTSSGLKGYLDGEHPQGTLARIQMDTSGIDDSDTSQGHNNILDFGDDHAVQVFAVGDPGDIPRAIVFDDDDNLWLGFHMAHKNYGYFMQYKYNAATETLDIVGGPYFGYDDGDPDYNIAVYEAEIDKNGILWFASYGSTHLQRNPYQNQTYAADNGMYSFDTNDPEDTLIRYGGIPNGYGILIDNGDLDDPDDPVKVYATTNNAAGSDYNLWMKEGSESGNFEALFSYGSARGLRGMTFDANGGIWIAASQDNRVAYYDPSGVNDPASYPGFGETPVGVGSDLYGNLWVIVRDSDQIRNFDPEDPTGDKTNVGMGYRPYAYALTVVPEVPTYEICGFKYLEGSDPLLGLAGWTIILEMWDDDANDGGAWVEVHTTVTSDGTDDLELGQYCFDNLLEGEYRITETVEPGWTQVSPYDENAEEGYKYAYVVELPAGATYADPESPTYYNFINEEDRDPVCETAWAKGETAVQNNKVEGNPSNAWGWTNLLDKEEMTVTDGVYSLEMDLWAAAGQNDTSKGELVGTVTVEWEGDIVTVTYELDCELDCWFDETHLWVGGTELPLRPQGRFQTLTPTAAPGQFLDEEDYNMTTNEDKLVVYEVDISGLGDEIWVAAHAVVCCYDLFEVNGE